MSETIYCYHCGRPHPKEEMRRVYNRSGWRWRCAKSIEATKRPAAERDAFGKKVSAMNTAERRSRALGLHQMTTQLGR